MAGVLRQVDAKQLPALLRDPVDAETLAKAAEIVANVRNRGEEALRLYARQFNELAPGGRLVLGTDEMLAAYESIPQKHQDLLKRVADRIETFALAQHDCLSELTMPLPGGQAGHYVAPVERAGCYAPGGGFPLPSSMLMTVVTARAAGVKHVVAASPNAATITVAAAYVAGADLLLSAGGAHAIAAMAYGTMEEIRSDVIVGPGSRWVTAAKQLVSGRVGIDMLAGPSELVVLADDTADPRVVASDLIAQAEHGYDSLPVLVTTDEKLIERTNNELAKQLEGLPTRETAEASLSKGYAVLAESMEEARHVSDEIAPEHLELICENASELARKLKHYGGLFIGSGSAEVLGDYGAGPNHTLPTGGTARFTGGLSVYHFLRTRTWMRMEDLEKGKGLVEDARELARLENLEGHARSAERRLPSD